MSYLSSCHCPQGVDELQLGGFVCDLVDVREHLLHHFCDGLEARSIKLARVIGLR